MSMSTKVFSKHFVADCYSSEYRLPTFFLKVLLQNRKSEEHLQIRSFVKITYFLFHPFKGCDVPCSSQRSSPRKRLSEDQSFTNSEINTEFIGAD